MPTDISDSEHECQIANIAAEMFGVPEKVLVEALLTSPNARGYIIGAISEVLLRDSLKNSGFHVLRIKEKWEGEKKHHGDFYISLDQRNWFIVESKGLKSNSEKWARTQGASYYEKLATSKRNSEEVKWFHGLPDSSRLVLQNETNQENIRLCQTHMPSGKATNEKKTQGRTQASPRVDEFHLLAVDMYTKTGVHEFVFAVSDELSRSKKDPNHLLQNYFITLVMPTTMRPIEPFAVPWSRSVEDLFARLKNPVEVQDMQIDERRPGQRAEGVLSF